MRDNLLVICFFGTISLFNKSLTISDYQVIISIILTLAILFTHLLKILYVLYFLILWLFGKETISNLPKYIKAVEGKNDSDKNDN
jgi:hypothetical protein